MDPLDPEIVRSLSQAGAYPDDASAGLGVQWIQTHLSHVFLTRDRVAKLRKDVDLSFVSFADRPTRNDDCLREIELNRRLAPDVYLGVSEVEPVANGSGTGTESGSGTETGIATESQPVYRLGPIQRNASSLPAEREHCVIMRRLPDGRDARSLARAGALQPEAIDRAAALIARFHHSNRLGCPSPFSPEEWWERNWEPAQANFEIIETAGCPGVDPQRARAAAELTRASFESRRSALEMRRCEGRAVHGHGDLHLQHLWFEDDHSEPVIIDCVEFSESLRMIDGASEIAFLAMDLRFSGEAALAERVLRRYASELDDFGLYDVVDLFVSYRAAVRSKVAALASVDPAVSREQREREAVSAGDYLTLAQNALAPRSAGPIVVVCGSVGSGKSTAAEALASQTGGALVSSDRLRKQLLGREPDAPTPTVELASLYAPERVAAVYEAVFERSRHVARSGRPVVLDATFSRAADRQRARALASELGAKALLVELRCSPGVATERTQLRQQRAADASDAGPERVLPSRESFEPPAPDEWSESMKIVVETDAADWRESLRAQVARRLAPGAAWS